MQTLHEIKEFIVAEFVPGGKPEDIPDNLDLVQTGVIDSLGVLNLIAALEDEVGIRVQPEDMNAETFSTVVKIHGFISDRVGAGG